MSRERAEQEADQLAPGCCSAMNPCRHQQKYPDSVCADCAAAAKVALGMAELHRALNR